MPSLEKIIPEADPWPPNWNTYAHHCLLRRGQFAHQGCRSDLDRAADAVLFDRNDATRVIDVLAIGSRGDIYKR